MGYRNKQRLDANPISLISLADAMIEEVKPEIPEGSIIRRADGAMVYKRFVMWPVGMEIPNDVTEEELLDVGRVINGLNTSIQWIVGDWLNAAHLIWGETYQQVASELGYAIKTVYEWAWVCRKVSIRMEKLTFGYHQAVAGIEDDRLQQRWLQRALMNGWSIAKLRAEMRDKPETELTPEKQAANYTSLVKRAAPNLQALDNQRRQQIAEKADWLAGYYADIARRARGE